MSAPFAPADRRDPLHDPGLTGEHWSTDNVGEAAPGVLTPLTWSVWGDYGNRAMCELAYRLGAFSRAERDSDHRWVRIFYGRIALQMEYLALVGDRLPGTSAEEVLTSIFGRVPEGIVSSPTRRRYPVIAARMPIVFAAVPRQIRALARDAESWWRSETPRLGGADQAAATAILAGALERFGHAVTLQSIGLLGVIQPLYDAVAQLVARTGVGELGVLSGSGGAEMAIVGDLWKASRGQLALEQVVANHGFHGPREGELCARVWREDSAPLERLIADYAEQDSLSDPGGMDQESRARRAVMHRELLAALPRARRPAVRVLLSLAADRIPLRGVAKRAFLQSLDVARASARRLGEHLTAQQLIDDPEDVFYLLADELIGELPRDTKELVSVRRERRLEYEALALPGNWKGTPAEQRVDDFGKAAKTSDLEPVSGLGVSGGVVEGTVRVVTDPAFADVEPGEVLVSATTDPSWSSIMFISAALVVDIGSALSHAAVVARELGIPCVVNTRVGTRSLQTGDLVRVDGSAGTVEILLRGPRPVSRPARDAAVSG